MTDDKMAQMRMDEQPSSELFQTMLMSEENTEIHVPLFQTHSAVLK